MLISIFCITQLFTLNALANNNDKIKETANNELKKYSKILNWSDHNFSSQVEFENATVDQGLPVFRFDATKLANGVSNLQDAMYDTNTIEYVVKSNGKNITRFSLVKQGDSYVKYKIGGNGENLSKGFSQLSADNFNNAKLIKLGPATFLYTKFNDNEIVIYLDDVPMDGIKTLRPYTSDQIVPVLQQFSKSMISSSTDAGGIGSTSTDNSNFAKAYIITSIIFILMITVLITRFYIRKQHNI